MSTDHAESFFRDFHARFPGATTTAMAWAKTEDGRSPTVPCSIGLRLLRCQRGII